MLKETHQTLMSLIPAVAFVLLVLYLIMSDPGKIGPF